MKQLRENETLSRAQRLHDLTQIMAFANKFRGEINAEISQLSKKI
jgi:hypothetical protein